jgi:hypothetical protein
LQCPDLINNKAVVSINCICIRLEQGSNKKRFRTNSIPGPNSKHPIPFAKERRSYAPSWIVSCLSGRVGSEFRERGERNNGNRESGAPSRPPTTIRDSQSPGDGRSRIGSPPACRRTAWGWTSGTGSAREATSTSPRQQVLHRRRGPFSSQTSAR